MDSLDNLFEAIYQEARKSRKHDFIENDYGEKWKKLSHSSKEFKSFDKVVKKVRTSKSKIDLLDIAQVNNSKRYIAVLCGGLNGSGNWVDYFKDLERLLKEYTGKAWVVDIENDCADDIFYVNLAITEK